MKIAAKAHNQNSIVRLNVLATILTGKEAKSGRDYDGSEIATIGHDGENLKFDDVVVAMKRVGATDSEIAALKKALFLADGTERNYVTKSVSLNGFYVHFETTKTRYTPKDRNEIQKDVAELTKLSCFTLRPELEGGVEITLTKEGKIRVEGTNGWSQEYSFLKGSCPIASHQSITHREILVRTDGK